MNNLDKDLLKYIDCKKEFFNEQQAEGRFNRSPSYEAFVNKYCVFNETEYRKDCFEMQLVNGTWIKKEN